MIYLGLGANRKNRRSMLADAIERLQQNGFTLKRMSPVVESPALLKLDAPSEWNQPYLNLVIEGDSELTPQELLKLAKKIEQQMGRDLSALCWSPRNIDIDILLWHDDVVNTPELMIPHPQMYKRSFVITPLVHLIPHQLIPGINLTPLQISQQIRPIPLWMGIINLTPDSFSDGGRIDNLVALEAQLSSWITAGVHILDFGAESTRPKAGEISAEQEWSRLGPVFPLLERLREKHSFMPLASIDTRHVSTAAQALTKGADWVNDVTGLRDPAMLDLIKETQATCVAMHSLSVPVKPTETLDTAYPVNQQLISWLESKAVTWEAQGLDRGNIIFDPGIGFGKMTLQNQAIIKATAELRNHGFRLLMGHSRKSFMSVFSEAEFCDRDIETLGLSLAMCEQGVDILRVHEPLQHLRAYKAWSHVR